MGSEQDEEENPRFRFSSRQEFTDGMKSKWDRAWKDFKQEVRNNDYSTLEKYALKFWILRYRNSFLFDVANTTAQKHVCKALHLNADTAPEALPNHSAST